MKPTKKQVIDKILSFDYEELERWIRARLHGDDKYFPTYEGYEPNLSEFLAETYENIKSKKFRDNFLEILNDLTEELSGYSTGEAQKEADYIYELLCLCAAVRQFENADVLYEIAVGGDLKGIKAHDLDLHQLLLNTLGSFRLSGDYEFWFEQMRDDSNKYYANAAFYALLNREYSLDIIFRCMDVFIQRFKGEIDLELGIQELIDKYGEKEVSRRFAGIEEILSLEQKEAVNKALAQSGYDQVYQLENSQDPISRKQEILYSAEMVGKYAPQYENTTKLQEQTILFLRYMGYQEELNPVIAGHSIDIFFKMKKYFKNEIGGETFECLACFFYEEEKKVEENEINRLGPIKQDIWNELQKESNKDRCDEMELIVICQEGFTPGAIKAAKTYGIELRTVGQLFDELVKFDKSRKKFIHHSKSM